MTKKRVLVTGGLGFIGSHLVDLLLKLKNIDVTVMDNLSSDSSARANMRSGVTYWIDDIRNLNTVKYHPQANGANKQARELVEFDVIYHLAALARIQPSFIDPLTYLDVDVMGTAHVLEYARQYRSRVVYAGSSSAYADTMLNPYSFAKYTGEQMCEMYAKLYNMSTVTARFFNVYGDRQPKTGPYATVVGVFEDQISRGVPLTVTGDGEQRRDFTYVTDIVRGLVALSGQTWKGEVFNLGSGRNYSINELAQLFRPHQIRHIPARPGEARVTLANISKTTEVTGWKPEFCLEEYIRNRILRGHSPERLRNILLKH